MPTCGDPPGRKMPYGKLSKQQQPLINKVLLKLFSVVNRNNDVINNIDFIVEKLNHKRLRLSGDINSDLAKLYLPLLIDDIFLDSNFKKSHSENKEK